MTSFYGRGRLTKTNSPRRQSGGNVSRSPNHKPELRLADYDAVTIFQRLTRNAAVVHRHPIGAVEVFDDRVGRPRKNHGMVAADELRIDLQIVVRSSSNRRL